MPPSIANTPSIPLKMRAPIQSYAHDLNGDKRLKAPAEIESVYRLAEFMGRRGVPRWEELKASHYEAYLRSIDPIVMDSSDPRVTKAVTESKRAARFMDYLVEKELLPESPAWRIQIDKQGLVRKLDETHPEFDGPIAEFGSRRRAGRDPKLHLGVMRSFAGFLLLHDVNFLRDIKPTHIEMFAHDRVQRSVIRHDRASTGLQINMEACEAFFDFAKRKKLVDSNPAEGFYITGKGRIFTPDKVPVRMQNAIDQYDKKELAESPNSTRVGNRSYLREMMHHVCGNHGVRTWTEMTPAHYDDFVRNTWGRWAHHPELAQHRHAICSRFLDHQLARSPAKGFRLELNGTLTSPLTGKPEKLPEQFTLAATNWKGIPGMHPAFAEEANTYRERVVDDGKVGSRKRVEQVMREFSTHLADRGVKNWKAVKPHDVEVFGRDLITQKGVKTAYPQFIVVKQFMADLEERKVRPDDPTMGFRMTEASGFVVPERIDPHLVDQTDKTLWKMYPAGEEGKSRKAYKDVLRPLMLTMTTEGIKDWSDLTHERLKRYSDEEIAENHPGSHIQNRISIRLFCDAQFGKGPENPAYNMFKQGKREQRLYSHLMHEGEDPLIIQKITPPFIADGEVLKYNSKPAREAVAPGD